MSSSFVQMFPTGGREGDDEGRRQPQMPPWFGPSEDELGAVVPLGLVLGRSEKGAVALSHATVYSTGLALDVIATARGLSNSQSNRLFHEQHLFDEGEDPPSGFLRIGIELPDGERVSNLAGMGGRFMKPDEEPDGPVFMQRGGGGGSAGEGRVRMSPGFWLWPRPESGALRIFCEWPVVEIALSTVEIDLAEVAAAAERVVAL